MSGADILLDKDVNDILGANDLVLIYFSISDVNFYKKLNRWYDEAADSLKKFYPSYTRIVIGKIYCDLESKFASKCNVFKYPRIKLFCNGKYKKDYTSNRSAVGLIDFVKKEYADLKRKSFMGGSVDLDVNNIRQVLAANDLVLVSVYMQRYRLLENLVFEEASDRLQEILPDHAKVLMGKILLGSKLYNREMNCDYQRCKFGSFRVFCYGEYAEDYKGEITVECLVDFVVEKYNDLRAQRCLRNIALSRQKKTRRKKQTLVADQLSLEGIKSKLI